MSELIYRLPDPEVVGTQLGEGLDSDFDSLTIFEVVEMFAKRTGAEVSDDDIAEMGMPENSTSVNLMILHEYLAAGEPVDTKIFGIPIHISPIQTVPEQGPDPSGVREPRNPIRPLLSGSEEMESLVK